MNIDLAQVLLRIGVQLSIFLLALVVLKRFVFQPLLRIRALRSEQSITREVEAERVREQAEEVAEECDHSIQQAYRRGKAKAEEVFIVADMLRAHYLGKRDDFFRPETVREIFRRQDLFEGSTWALGWDTPSRENSSSGRYFSSKSVGHLGFTGTSVWMDLEKDVIVILLTNRVHPIRKNEKIRAFRPRLHDKIMEAILGIRHARRKWILNDTPCNMFWILC